MDTDFYVIEELLTEDEITIRDQVRFFADKEIVPSSTTIGSGLSFPSTCSSR